MEELSPNEVANLLVGIITLLLILFVFSRARSERLKHFFPGFFFMLAASFFTLAEEFVAPDLFNFLEHLSFALAAWAFLLACLRVKRAGGSAGG